MSVAGVTAGVYLAGRVNRGSELVAGTTSRSSLQPQISASLANVFHSQRHQLLQ